MTESLAGLRIQLRDIRAGQYVSRLAGAGARPVTRRVGRVVTAVPDDVELDVVRLRRRLALVILGGHFAPRLALAPGQVGYARLAIHEVAVFRFPNVDLVAL